MSGVDLGPCLNNGQDFSRCEICESFVVGWREGKDVAFSCYGIGAEEKVGEICCSSGLFPTSG